MAKEIGNVVLLKIGANAVGATRSLSISGSNALIDVTTKEDPWKRYKSGRKSWNVSLGGVRDVADTNGQTALLSAIQAGTGLSIVVGKSTPASGDHTLGGSVNVESFSEDNSEGSETTYEVSLRGNGALTLTTI